jgi:hypothetical protein
MAPRPSKPYSRGGPSVVRRAIVVLAILSRRSASAPAIRPALTPSTNPWQSALGRKSDGSAERTDAGAWCIYPQPAKLVPLGNGIGQVTCRSSVVRKLPRRWTARLSRRASSSRHVFGGSPTTDSPSPGERQGGRRSGTAGGRPGVRHLLVSYLLAASLRCQASNVASVIGKIWPSACGVWAVPARRSTPGRPTGTRPGRAAQHRVLVAEHDQLSILGQVLAGYQCSEAEYPANQQVDDLEQHPASQPSPRPGCWRWRRSATQSIIRAAHDPGAACSSGQTAGHGPGRG